jgi:8-oxo-dGTP pyrophosphatase MutT (NUDIX family)
MTLPPLKARFSLCVIEDHAQQLLFLHRAGDRPLGPGLWGFPAGHIEPGESPRDCAYREMREEIGPAVRVQDLRSLGPFRDSFYGGVYEIHLYHMRWISGPIVLNHEHTEYRWANVATYRALDLMDGIEEDIALLDIWPRSALNPARLPPHLRLP